MSQLQRKVSVGMVALCLMVTVSTVRADRYIALSFWGAPPPNPIPQGTFYIGAQTLGSSSIETLLVGSFPGGSVGDDCAKYLRDQMMPVVGIPGVGRRAYVRGPVSGTYEGFQLFHPDNVQFWASVDGTNWVLIEAGGDVTLIVGTPPDAYTSITFREFGSNGTVATGNVPAVSTWGLAVLLLLLLAAGAVLIAKRPRIATT